MATTDRPVSLMEIQQIVSGKGCRFPAPGPSRRARIGPSTPCAGPTVGILGAPIGVGTGWTGCPTEESVAIPPYVPPTVCEPDPCEQETISKAVQDALDGPGSPLVHVEVSAQQEPDVASRRNPSVPKGGAVVVCGGSAGALAAAAALRMGVGGVPGPAAIGLAATVQLGGSVATTIAVASNGQVLPQATINVASTAGFPSSGTIAVQTSASLYQIVQYTGTTATTFTGCSGGVGTMATGGAVLGPLGVPTAVYTFYSSDSRLLISKGLQIDSSDSSIWNSTQFSVEVSGYQELLLANLTPGDFFPINLFVPPGGSITLFAACLDPTLAAVLAIKFDKWTKAVVTIDGSVDVLNLGRDPARRRA